MHDALAGRVLVRSDFRVPRLATVDLSGRKVHAVVSRGKHMLTRIDGDLTLHTHFEMDGSWHLYRPGTRWSGGPAHQVRVVLENADWQAVGYRLPVIELVATDDEASVVGHLGPDILDPDSAWDAREALRRLLAAPGREIGPALLDQRNLAGIGNLYKAEALFLAGRTPWTQVRDMPDLAALLARARRLMRANRDHWQQTTTGSLRRGEEHWVFERAGRPCRRCGTPIRSAEQVEPEQPAYGRLSYWCPACQAGPAPTPPAEPGGRPPRSGRPRSASGP
jgi:endonuclease VIII